MNWNFITNLGAIFTMALCTTDSGGIAEFEKSLPVRSDVHKKAKLEEKLGKDIEKLVPPDEMTWVVMIFEFFSLDSFEPLCFGTLITGADVMTTCSCLARYQNDSSSSHLMVKPKASIVEWDDDYRPVIHILYHDHCDKCSYTSYNDMAILTIEALIIMERLVEPIPNKITLPEVHERTLTWDEMYRDCFILGLVSGFKTSYQGSLEVEKYHFTVWKTPSTANDLGTVPIFGSSLATTGSMFRNTRFAGSLLMCQRKNGFVPVGLYLGVKCPERANITPNYLRESCIKKLHECEDCVPKSKPVRLVSSCYSDDLNDYETVMRFNSLIDWIDENVFEPLQNTEYTAPHYRSSSLPFVPSISPKVYISIALIKTTF